MGFEKVTKDEIRRDIITLLSGNIVDVELGVEDLDFAIKYALGIYRQRADNAVKEQGIIFGTDRSKQVYDFSDRPDIINILGIYRNSLGSTITTGVDIDPFVLQYTNQINNFMGNQGGYGSLATIDFQRQYLEQLEKIMAHHIQYYWDKSNSKLTIFNRIGREEAVLIMAECWKSEEELFNDYDIKPWLTSYAAAKAKQILGEGRSKFQTLAGPSGGVTLNGNELKTEAQAEIEALEEQLKNFVTSNTGMPFIMF